jgi:hypothetical protein
MVIVQGLNLVLRFVLELIALVAAGTWGFVTFDNWALRLLFGFGIPVVMAAAWGIFRVPGDGGPPIIAVGGRVRLVLEVVFFVVAVGLLGAAGYAGLATIFAVVLLVHYAIGYERTLALLADRRSM